MSFMHKIASYFELLLAVCRRENENATSLTDWPMNVTKPGKESQIEDFSPY